MMHMAAGMVSFSRVYQTKVHQVRNYTPPKGVCQKNPPVLVQNITYTEYVVNCAQITSIDWLFVVT